MRFHPKLFQFLIRENWKCWQQFLHFSALWILILVSLILLFPYYCRIVNPNLFSESAQKIFGTDEINYYTKIGLLIHDIIVDIKYNTETHNFIQLTNQTVFFTIICLIITNYILYRLARLRYYSEMVRLKFVFFLLGCVPPFFIAIIMRQFPFWSSIKYILGAFCLIVFNLGLFWNHFDDQLKTFYSNEWNMLRSLHVKEWNIVESFVHNHKLFSFIKSQFIFMFPEMFAIEYIFELPGISGIFIEGTLRQSFRMWYILYPLLFQLFLYWLFLAIIASAFFAAAKTLLNYHRYLQRVAMAEKLDLS